MIFDVLSLTGEVELKIFGTDPGFANLVYEEKSADIIFELPIAPETRTVYFTISATKHAVYQLFLGGTGG